MDDLKTLFLCLSLLTVPAAQAADRPRDMVREFAVCAGRLSAELHHQWLVSDPAADLTEHQHAAMVGLLEAVMPRDAGPMVLHERLAARQAHAALLSRADFGSDARLSAWSRRRAAAEIGYCRELMLF